VGIEYVDHVKNHWYWRPGWRAGRHFYACHIIFPDESPLHGLVEAYQQALQGFQSLDLIPPKWLHMTMQGIGFVDEITEDQLAAITDALRTRLAQVQVPVVTFDRPVVVTEAVYLPATPAGPMRAVQAAARDAIAETLGQRLDARPYRPHVSLAYVAADQPGQPIAHAIDGAVALTDRRTRWVDRSRSDRAGEFSERRSDPLGGWRVDGEFVVPAAEVLHKSVSNDDHLRGPIRSESTHRSEPVLELAVICFDWIVRMPFNVMPRRRDQLLHHGRVDRGGVGHDLARRHLQHGQRSLEEPAGRGRIAFRRDEHVDDLPVLVDGPVHIPPDTVDPDIRLVHEPPVTR
jgi:2'-5' RNA ligase